MRRLVAGKLAYQRDLQVCGAPLSDLLTRPIMVPKARELRSHLQGEFRIL